MITILVKPQMQHSKTHTFLVWSLRKIIKEYPGIKNVQEHLIKDADLTFTYEKQVYALEVETGTLLGKKEQLNETLAYLLESIKIAGYFLFHIEIYYQNIANSANVQLEKI